MEHFSLLDWILPAGCALCGLPVPGGGCGICEPCRSALPRIPAECCRLCGSSLAGSAAHAGEGHGHCIRCRSGAAGPGAAGSGTARPEVVCRGALEYSEEVAFLLARFKANRDRRLGRWVAREIGAVCRRHWSEVMIAPIPGSPGNVRRRGWDHMKEVARLLAEDGFAVIDLLERRGGPEQKGLGRAERHAAMVGSLRLRRGRAGQVDRPLVLLDDLRTSGASIEAAGEVVTQAKLSLAGAALLAIR